MINLKKLLFFNTLQSASFTAQKAGRKAFLAKFNLPYISIRAVQVTHPSSFWFEGLKGWYRRIVDEQLEIDFISNQGRFPGLRLINCLTLKKLQRSNYNYL